MRQLSLATRPKTLDGLVGQSKLVKAIRGHWKTGRVQKAWMFFGPKGTGKTSISRVLALSYQCQHQTVFGRPCKECYAKKSSFPIYEINTASTTGIDKLREQLQGSEYGVMGDASYLVYILDECHRLSGSAQDLLLKYLEDTPDSTIFILCSTRPHNVSETIRRRCVMYEMKELEMDGLEELVNKLLAYAKSELPGDRLVDQLVEFNVRSPGLVCMAVEKYIAGLSPEEAAQVEGASGLDTHALCRAVVTGDWEGVAKAMLAAQTSDARSIRMSVLGYLRKMLLESPEITTNTLVVAKSILGLAQLQNAEDFVIMSALAAELYKLTSMFARYRR